MVCDSWESICKYENWESAAKLAPVATALIAGIAAYFALRSIWTHRDIARRRAAIDFFLKTEMDASVLSDYEKSRLGFKKLNDGVPLEPFCVSGDYALVRKYLNIHDLMAVGVQNGVLDDDVCFSFWADVLTRDYRAARHFIAHIRSVGMDASQYTYNNLERLDKEWERKLNDIKSSLSSASAPPQ